MVSATVKFSTDDDVVHGKRKGEWLRGIVKEHGVEGRKLIN
jgi:hypothetical protein